MNIEVEKIRNFFILALINASMKVSYAWKDGAVLKVRKKPKPPLRKIFRYVCKKMIKNIKKSPINSESMVIVKQADAKNLPLEDNSISNIITSPPYLNKIEYTRIYEIESLILSMFKKLKKPTKKQYIGGKDFDSSKVNSIPDYLSGLPLESISYFKDMENVLKEMYRVCKKNANVFIIVGNGYFPKIKQYNKGVHLSPIVESDIILSKIAERIGFMVKKIYLLNERSALKDRTKKIGSLRESMLLLKK